LPILYIKLSLLLHYTVLKEGINKEEGRKKEGLKKGYVFQGLIFWIVNLVS